MPDQSFPSNLLEFYLQNTLAGGNPSGLVGPADLTYLQGAILSLQKMFLKHHRVHFVPSLAYMQEAVVPGDALAIDLNRDAADDSALVIPFIGKWSTIKGAGGGAVPILVGMSVVTAGSGSLCLYAAQGPVEARFTGIAPGQFSSGGQVTFDVTTNKARVAVPGDEIHGYASPKGSMLLLGTGRPA